jgi:hypothetical protein
LYQIDSTSHSPLLGFAYDGFPIYGAYAYQDASGTGPIVRMKSSFQLRNISVRNTYANGNTVTAGPPVNATYPLGYFREDYEYIATSAATPDYLDEHNGRFCVTPEYPNGTYAYFCTVDANWNSAYPYAVGPTFYGIKTALKVNNITEPVSTYTPGTVGISSAQENLTVKVFPSPANDFIAIQLGSINASSIEVSLFDLAGKTIAKTQVLQGSTIAYFDTQTLYAGEYLVRIQNGNESITRKIILVK